MCHHIPDPQSNRQKAPRNTQHNSVFSSCLSYTSPKCDPSCSLRDLTYWYQFGFSSPMMPFKSPSRAGKHARRKGHDPKETTRQPDRRDTQFGDEPRNKSSLLNRSTDISYEQQQLDNRTDLSLGCAAQPNMICESDNLVFFANLSHLYGISMSYGRLGCPLRAD
jgi:hypothetical protein